MRARHANSAAVGSVEDHMQSIENSAYVVISYARRLCVVMFQV